MYKCRVNDLETCKASELGEYIPARLGFDEGENPLYMALTTDYSGYMLFFFASGKVAKVPLASYATKLNRKKLVNAYNDKDQLVYLCQLQEEGEMAIRTSGGRLLLFGTAQIAPKATKNTAGVSVITLKKNQHIDRVCTAAALELANPHRYRVRSLPAAGAVLRQEDLVEQTTLGEEQPQA